MAKDYDESKGIQEILLLSEMSAPRALSIKSSDILGSMNPSVKPRET